MANMRRRTPEPPPGPPQVQFRPGLANETLHELAPLLAEEGIDVDNIDVPDLDTLQHAMNRAVERHNMARFTPVGPARDLAVAALRLVVEAIADDDTAVAAAVLDESSRNPRTTRRPPSPLHRRRPRPARRVAVRARSDHARTSWPQRSVSAGHWTANAPPPTSSRWPARDEPSAPSTR